MDKSEYLTLVMDFKNSCKNGSETALEQPWFKRGTRGLKYGPRSRIWLTDP